MRLSLSILVVCMLGILIAYGLFFSTIKTENIYVTILQKQHLLSLKNHGIQQTPFIVLPVESYLINDCHDDKGVLYLEICYADICGYISDESTRLQKDGAKISVRDFYEKYLRYCN